MVLHCSSAKQLSMAKTPEVEGTASVPRSFLGYGYAANADLGFLRAISLNHHIHDLSPRTNSISVTLNAPS